MKTTKVSQSRIATVDFDNLGFGEYFTDHMFSVEYLDGRWQEPEIMPYGPFQIYPAMCTLHYGQAVFEGMKAFHTPSGAINVFRPDKHHERWNRSCRRLCIPEVDRALFIGAVEELVRLDQAWVPTAKGCSLYIRPVVVATDNYIGLRVSKGFRFMVIASPVAAYYKEGLNPVRLITTSEYVRAAKGGLGAAKTPANYAASILPAEEAHEKGFTQVLWLDGVEHRYIEEVGTMNILFLIEDELITPPLGGTILAGVTRDSVLHLARDWGLKVSERQISIDEVFTSAKDGRLREVFGAGTAAVISPVGEVQHEGAAIKINEGKIGRLAQSLYDEITGIQYGERADRFGWCHSVR